MLNVAVFVFIFENIHFLHECINFEMRIGNKVCNFISLYRSPNQSLEEFETFADDLELNLDRIAKNNPFLIALLGDLNTRLSKWYKNGSKSHEDTKVELTHYIAIWDVTAD